MKRYSCDLGVLLFLGAVLVFLPPLWRTNDDIGMSMIAHGYGLASEPSSYLLFTNVIWHKLVSVMPNIEGATPYALASMMTLFISCLGLLLISRRLRTPISVSHCAIIFVMIGPLLSPQFTINAGLSTAVGLLFLKLYAAQKNRTDLITATLFVCLGFLIREQEALLVGFIAAPLFLKYEYFKDQPFQLFVVIVVVLLSTLMIVDKQAYSSAQWREYNELNKARIPYTDFKFGKLILKNPELMAAENVSKNDIKLMRAWFFEDKKIASSEKLSRMVQKIRSQLINQKTTSERIKSGFLTFKKHSSLLLLSSVGLLVLLLSMNTRLAFAWLQLAITVCIVSVLGRPSVARIYEPALMFLCIYPLFFFKLASWRMKVLPFVACIAMSIVVSQATWTHNKKLREAKDYQKRFADLALRQQVLIVWGSSLKYEHLFTPFKISDFDFQSLEIYGLGVFAYMPYSTAQRERDHGRSMLELLVSDEGATIAMSKGHKKMLNTYCEEHLETALVVNFEQRLDNLLVANVHCRGTTHVDPTP